VTSFNQFPVREVARIVGGGTPSKDKAAYWNGDIPWVSPKDMWVDEVVTSKDKITAEAIKSSATNLVPASAVLCVVRSGILARTFPVAITRREVAINQDIKAIIPNKELDGRYLYYFMKASEPKILAGVTTGATVHRVATSAIAELSIPLPPLDKQRRLVAVLDEAFAAIANATANAEKNLANAHLIIQSAIDSAFLDVGADRESKALSALIDITHGYAFDGTQFKTSDDQSKPIVLTPGNYTEDADLSFTQKNTKRLVCGIERPGYRFNAGDLTVVMTDLSSRMKILGRPAFVESNDVLHNQRIGRVVLKSDDVILKLIYYFLQTSIALAKVRDTATGTMVRHTAPTRILSGTISYPRLRATQSALVTRLDAISLETRTFATRQVAKIASLTELKHSFLRSAFAGEFADRELDTLLA
jgi:restriction endonuclease S subunit